MSLIEGILKTEIALRLFRFVFYFGFFAILISSRLEIALATSIKRTVFVIWVISAAFLVVNLLIKFFGKA